MKSEDTEALVHFQQIVSITSSFNDSTQPHCSNIQVSEEQ